MTPVPATRKPFEITAIGTVASASVVRTQVMTAGGAAVNVNRVIIQKGEERQIALYWYQGRGRAIANEYWSKAWLVWDAATRNRTDGALVRVIRPIRPGDEAGVVADARTRRFVSAIYPRLADYLPE